VIYWIERKHGKKKKYIKIHFATDAKTKEIVAMSITTDETHDSKEPLAYNYSRMYSALRGGVVS